MHRRVRDPADGSSEGTRGDRPMRRAKRSRRVGASLFDKRRAPITLCAWIGRLEIPWAVLVLGQV